METERSVEETTGEVSEPIPTAAHLFDPWLTTNSNDAAVMAEVLAGKSDTFFQSVAEASGPRQRRMREKDKENLLAAIQATWANLFYVIACGHEPPAVAVSLRASKRKVTRYDREGFAILPKMLEAVATMQDASPRSRLPLAQQAMFGDLGWTLHKSSQRGVASTIVARPAIVWMVRRMGFKPDSFHRAPGSELIILTRTTSDFVARTRSREWIDYGDTPESERYRAELSRINAYLAKAPLGFEKDGGPAVPIRNTEMRRFFSLLSADSDDRPRFDQGGRLFGGWWQGLPKARRSAIRIEGEPIADIDFSNMFLRLAYLDAGHEPPPGDLYAGINGLDDPRWRDGVKKVANAMLFRSTPLVRLPRDPELRDQLPPGVKGPEVRAAIRAAHPLLADTFETGSGFRLMFMESQTLVAALLNMIEADVPALPMHDGAMVPRSKAQLAAECMGAAAKQITGRELPITLK